MNNRDITFGLFNEKNEPTYLESIDYELTFHDLLIDSKVVQKFTNRATQNSELCYKYRSEHSPHMMEVRLYDPETKKTTTMSAKVHKKETATEKYDDSISDGNRAVLMEQSDDDPNLYTLSLGNIKPNMEITISSNVVCTARLETDEEDPDQVCFSYTIPALQSESGKTVKDTQSVAIITNDAVSVTSPSYMDIFEKTGSNRYATKKKTPVTREFEIEVKHVKYPFSQFRVTKLKKKFQDFTHAGILSLIPNFAAQSSDGYELILVIDCSGSMGLDDRMSCAVEALKLFLASLDPDRKIRYNIIRFGSTFNKCFHSSVELKEDENFKFAMKYVTETTANLGGTQMLGPIREGLKDVVNPMDHKHVKLCKDYVDQNCCTFNLTGSNFTYQQWWNCEQCKLVDNTGCCTTCAKTCHMGHYGVKLSTNSPSMFFCDCGAENPHCFAKRNNFDISKVDKNFEENEAKTKFQKQLFLFTDGEDMNPSSVEKLLRDEHIKNGIRCFSFGIGRGISRTFLQNCADMTKGSACFISDIRQEMKAQVLKQLSNAFRTSIDDITFTKGLNVFNDEIVESRNASKISKQNTEKSIRIFNGRAHHRYYFMKSVPKEIEVKYSFLGIESSEEVEIESVEEIEDGNSASTRVASEFVRCYDEIKDAKEIEDLGLLFNLSTKHTSFFMFSESSDSVVSEMKVEQVAPTREKSQPTQPQRIGFSPRRPMTSIGWGSHMNYSSPVVMGNQNFRYGNAHVAPNFNSQPKSRKLSSNFLGTSHLPIQRGFKNGSNSGGSRSYGSAGFGGGGYSRGATGFGGQFSNFSRGNFSRKSGNDRNKFARNTYSAPRAPPKISTPSPQHISSTFSPPQMMMQQSMQRQQPMMRQQTMMQQPMMQQSMPRQQPMMQQPMMMSQSQPQQMMQQHQFQSFSHGPKFGSGFLQKEEKQEKEKSQTEKKTTGNIGNKRSRPQLTSYISAANLTQLLFLASMKGLWKYSPDLLRLTGLSSKDMKNANFKYKEEFWATAVIISILQKFYRAKRAEWGLIVKKGMKNVTAKYGQSIFVEARDFVDSI